MLQAHSITRLHDEATLRWHDASHAPVSWDSAATAVEDAPLMEAALIHHQANFDLWHEEDRAREPEVSDARIAAVKHAIDALNQRRNDLVEEIDRMLLASAGRQNDEAPLHSESPGLIVDRLSILALKIYHTAEESHRASASEAHHLRNLSRLSLLTEQRSDLAACLDGLWADVLTGRQRFKLYRQLKMYNDPELNPLVYARTAYAKKPG
jgi:hypothetical protein